MQRAKQTSRDRLMEAARYLFWEKGYAATGMAELLERAQANSGSFYHFFDSKEALLLAVLEDYLEGLDPMVVQPAFALARDPIERIFAILDGYREKLVSTGCRYGCPLGRLALEIEPENLPAHETIARNFAAWSAAVRLCLEAARARFPRKTDLDALSVFVLSVMEGGVMQSRSYRRLGPFDQSVAQLHNYFACLLAGTREEHVNDKDDVDRRGRGGRSRGATERPTEVGKGDQNRRARKSARAPGDRPRKTR